MIRAADKTEPGGSPRDFHSSEVLSELPPLRVAVAGQGVIMADEVIAIQFAIDAFGEIGSALRLNLFFIYSSYKTAGSRCASSALLFPFGFTFRMILNFRFISAFSLISRLIL